MIKNQKSFPKVNNHNYDYILLYSNKIVYVKQQHTQNQIYKTYYQPYNLHYLKLNYQNYNQYLNLQSKVPHPIKNSSQQIIGQNYHNNNSNHSNNVFFSNNQMHKQQVTKQIDYKFMVKQIQQFNVSKQEWMQENQRIKERLLKYLPKKEPQFYKAISKIPIEVKTLSQIKKDVPRTFFRSENQNISQSKGQRNNLQKNIQDDQMLQNILISYAKFDPQVAYIQGLNFLAGSIMKIAKLEWLSFQLLKYLMKTKNLREFYLHSFETISKHCNIILNIYLRNLSPQLYHFFKQYQIDVTDFMIPWFLTLFSYIADIEYMYVIIEHYIADGIKFIYRLVLIYLIHLKEDILSAEQDCFLILGGSYSRKKNVNWSQLIFLSKAIKIDI